MINHHYNAHAGHCTTIRARDTVPPNLQFLNTAMLAYLKQQALMVTRAVIACSPWLLAMYLLYWIDKNQIWTQETPFRDPMSAAVVATGMLMSFFIYTRISSK